jgi:hypothetical protein
MLVTDAISNIHELDKHFKEITIGFDKLHFEQLIVNDDR